MDKSESLAPLRMAWFAGSNFTGAHDKEECVSGPASSDRKWRCSLTSTDWCCEDHCASTQATTWAIWGLVALHFNENMGYILAPTSSWLPARGEWFGQFILAKDVEEVLGHLQVNWPTACHIFFFSGHPVCCAILLSWRWGAWFWASTFFGFELATHSRLERLGSMQWFNVTGHAVWPQKIFRHHLLLGSTLPELSFCSVNFAEAFVYNTFVVDLYSGQALPWFSDYWWSFCWNGPSSEWPVPWGDQGTLQ